MRTTTTWRSGSATDAGLQRATNEDRIFIDQENGIFLVVDGLGGHAAGERAAEIAVGIITQVLDYDGRADERVRRAITAANNAIFRAGQTNEEWAGMACVLTLAVVHEELVTVGHVGDSRLYLVWNGTVRKLTSDHSPVGEREDHGELTESEAMTHPRRNEVFRDVGTRERAENDPDFIELRSFPLHPAAALLLCSDGLSDALTSAEMGEIVETYDGEPALIAQMLVKAANERGGTDNISVIFVAGEDFIGTRSLAMKDARARHAITRTRPARGPWRGRLAWLIWLVIGMLLGMAMWAAGERWL